MADDNKKPKTKEEIHEQNRKRVRASMFIPSPKTMDKLGIELVDKPIRPGASADSSGYYAGQWHASKANRRTAFKLDDKKMMDFFEKKTDEAKENYHRQKDKMKEGMIVDYDKDGHPISPFSSKKEIKPAAIVAPVKRPSEAVMKKLTGKK